MTCSCGAKLDVRARHGQCRRCRKRQHSYEQHGRRGAQITLADQLHTWTMIRDGWPVRDIAVALRRLPREVRQIAYGPP